MSGVIHGMERWKLLMRTVCDISVYTLKQNVNRKLLMSLISLYGFITYLGAVQSDYLTSWHV